MNAVLDRSPLTEAVSRRLRRHDLTAATIAECFALADTDEDVDTVAARIALDPAGRTISAETIGDAATLRRQTITERTTP